MDIDTEAANQLVERDRHIAAGEMEAASAINMNLAAAGVDPATVDYARAFPRPASAVEAQLELERLEADPNFVESLFDAKHPLHKANTAQRQILLDAATGAPVAEAKPVGAPIQPDEYRVHRDAPAADWDFETEGEFREVASALGMEQSTFDQVLYAWNTAAKVGVADTADGCRAEMEKRFGEELSPALNAWNEMLGSLGPEKEAAVRGRLIESGLGNSIPFAAIALDHALRWKAARSGPAKR